MPAAQMSVVSHCQAVWGSFQVAQEGQLAVWLDGRCAIFAAGHLGLGLPGLWEENHWATLLTVLL